MAVTMRRMKAQCQNLAEDLLLHRQASVEVLAALAPGGAENPKRDTWAWVWYHGQLQLLRGRAQGPHGDGRPTAAAASRDDAIALEALAGRPEVVRALDPSGTARDYLVYPKSFASLMHCHARDVIVGRLARVTAEIMDLEPGKLNAALTHDALEAIGYQTRVLCWIACTPGPGLPFGEHEREPALPAELRELDPLTVVELHRAFVRVNYLNLKALESLITPDPDGPSDRARPSWSVFFGALAIELTTDPADLIANRSLASVLASTQLSASTHRDAMAEAKRKAERERAPAA